MESHSHEVLALLLLSLISLSTNVDAFRGGKF
jgi:hypothetical protein